MVNILAYCDKRYQVATRRVVGDDAEVLTSPPVYAIDFQPDWLAGRDLIYLDLHGQPGSVYLYSGLDQDRAALHVIQVRTAKLGGAVVFATTCHLPETPFLQAFLEAGAGAVIGGGERNYGARRRLSGAQVLARGLLIALRAGQGIDDAFKLAKLVVRMDPLRWLADRKATVDALQFEIWRE